MTTEEELEQAKTELRSLETLQLPHESAKAELEWLDDNFAVLPHDQQARILNAITAARNYTELVG